MTVKEQDEAVKACEKALSLHKDSSVIVWYGSKGDTAAKACDSQTNEQLMNVAKAAGHRVCACPYIYEEALMKSFVMSWNQIVENQKSYKEAWDENLRSDDPLLKYKTKLLMRTAAAGPIRGFDLELMRIVMDIITVHEDGRLQIRFYDGTEFELAAE